MICSNNIYSGFCAQSNCNAFVLPLPAPLNGVYKIIVNWLGAEYVIDSTLEIGDEISFDIHGLPESAEMIATVIGPDENPVEFADGDIVFTVFLLKTNLTFFL